MTTKEEWEKTSNDITEINKIVSKCPEATQEKCFELLFNLKFSTGTTLSSTVTAIPNDDKGTETKNQQMAPYKLQGNVLAFLRRNGLTATDLEKLFMLDHQPILPTYKIDMSKVAAAQVQKAFMILLENALTSGQFKAQYSEIRDTCKSEGLYDGNFTANLRKQAVCFKGAITDKNVDESGTVELGSEGYTKLAEIIRQLAQ